MLLEVLGKASSPLGLLQIALETTPDGKPYEGGARWVVHIALLDSHLRSLVKEGVVERLDGPRYRRA